MKGLKYKENHDAVQGSFAYGSHENLAITGTASTSAALNITEILLSLTVSAHVKIGSGDADVSDMVLPAGVWGLAVNRSDTLSVLQLTGSVTGQASVIKPIG